MRLQHLIILQNKVDLVKPEAAREQHKQITDFVKGTVAEAAPIVPISAQLKYNIDVICELLVKRIPVPKRNFTDPLRLIVIRSFDVNKPGSEVDELKGGVAGGSIVKGVLKKGDEIEIRPGKKRNKKANKLIFIFTFLKIEFQYTTAGIVTKDARGKIKCSPIFSVVQSLFAESNDLNYAVPGACARASGFRVSFF